MTESFWQGPGDPDAPPWGHQVVAVHPHTLYDRAHALAVMPYAGSLKVAAGEHLAALLVSAFLALPEHADQAGEVDLTVKVPEDQSEIFAGKTEAAFEVKSMPGGFRRFASRAKAGDSHDIKIETAASVLQNAEEQIQRAYLALQRKVTTGQSPNIFLLIHPFEALALETVDDDSVVIGHRLPIPRRDINLDTLWILWYPDSLCRWSRITGKWEDLLFDAGNPALEEWALDPLDPELGRLMNAEMIFLSKAQPNTESPWIFAIRAAE